MPFQITMSELFPLDLARAPRNVQQKWQKDIAPRLRDHPNTVDPPLIKRLDGWKHLWRARAGDYRIIYKVDPEDEEVTLLMLGHRKDIYDRVGHDPDTGPRYRVIANEDMGDHLVREPSLLERGQALAQAPYEPQPAAPAAEDDAPLPFPIDEGLLRFWGIDEKYFTPLTNVRTENDVFALIGTGVPANVVLHFINSIWPPSIEEVENSPRRLVEDEEQLAALARGEKSLDDFLLALDKDQSPFVDRFRRHDATGPWILKGGPGCGKSTVAIYCIRALATARAESLDLDGRPLRILFTTYTKSLVAASKHLLRVLDVTGENADVDVVNIDQLASEYLRGAWRNLNIVDGRRADRERYVSAALERCRSEDPDFSLDMDDDEFLLDEVSWVIVGEDITSEDEYLACDRSGRGRGLTAGQRKDVWRFYEELTRDLRRSGAGLFAERLKSAQEAARPKYDYVFIDEAQDLSPIAIRFALALAKRPSNVFMTFDPNQAIYGSSMPWKKISEDLNFRGRARVFRKNYRTTREIWTAVTPLVDDLKGTDRETCDQVPVYHGTDPERALYSSKEEEVELIGSWMARTLISEKLTVDCGAILCPTNYDCARIAGALPRFLNARAFKTRDLDLEHPGVKVITMHAAKGLEFPVVAVTGLRKGTVPRRASGGVDEDDHDRRWRRLVFVACSRAMRRLLVLGDARKPSPYLGLTKLQPIEST